MELKKVGFKPKMMRTDEEILVINGKDMGFIMPMEGTKSEQYKWHCGINVEVQNELTTTLIQGFGPTKDEAVKNTLLKATEYADRLALAIAILKIDVGV